MIVSGIGSSRGRDGQGCVGGASRQNALRRAY